MKKKLYLLPLVLSGFFLLNSCAFLPHKKTNLIQWPVDIQYMEAICELTIAWNNTQFSGDMSVKLNYPDVLSLEVYGPFGETVFSIQKKKDSLVIRAGNDTFTNERQFFDMFKMTTRDFIDDISFKGTKRQDTDGTLYLSREQYRVTYFLGSGKDKICWEGPQGSMCIRFLDVSFDKKG